VEHRVLLRLVEAVDLVDEEDRPQAVSPEPVPRAADHRAHVVHAGGDRRQLLEGGAGPLGDDACDRRLARSRRPEEDHRRRAVLLDRAAEGRAGPEDVVLPDELLQGRGPQAHRERRVFRLALPRGFAEEVGHVESMLASR
jgi:hypothetical protein